ncbi:MAG: hypothetical protein WCP23_11660 [Planctomycetota bacterium]
MRRSAVCIALVVFIVITMNNEALARRYTRGRRGGGGSGGMGTSAAMGYAAMLRAQGTANLQNSQAAINWEKAKTAEIQNRLLWTQTYFTMRQVNHDMRLAERGPPITIEEAIKIAHDALPPPLDDTKLNPATGRIAYPDALRDWRYDDLRIDVDAFFKQKAVTGSVDFNELQQVETILNLLHAELKSNLSQYRAGDYGNAVTFIEQLKYEARRPVR